ncbi:hypothetical protein [Aquabacter sediminis]|uniref:hypothetical protein n=1 Tax=Aquabacter sediminis TaxID=3029197 RepID=UPI00237D5CBE|nr:hypothetical protein [Aquabacter sp. P-9]MDE1570599.1 hypothetical protein [Aquabacter sp. P-9]
MLVPRLAPSGMFLACALLAMAALGPDLAKAQQWTSAPSAPPASAQAPLGPNDTIQKADTRYGPVSVTTRYADNGDMSVTIEFRSQKITLKDVYGGNIEGQYQLGAEDVLIVSSTTGARGVPSNYDLIAIDANGMHRRENPNFGTSDFTFKVQKNYDNLAFDLGYEDGKAKSATYSDGVLKVSLTAPVGKPQLGKNDCATVLEYASECRRKQNCSPLATMEGFSMNVTRNLYLIGNNPAFSVDRFSKVCSEICRTRTYSALPVRKKLCGY